MTETQRAATRAALEALEETIDNLRAALAEQGEAEPFVWYEDDTGDTWTPGAVQDGGAPDGLRPLYTAPPRREWRGLTEEEQRLFSSWLDEKPDAEVFAAIEKTLREKNSG